MGNVINITDAEMEAFEASQNENNASRRSSNFDAKNYLDTRVPDGSASRTTTIRILPIDSERGIPFTEALHFHTLKVPTEIAASGWKSYLCLKKNPQIDHSRYGSKCPFCELNHYAYDQMEKATDPQTKEGWKKTSIANASREVRICRVIERGKESEGVKFWKINIRPNDNSDAFNQIMGLYKQRKEKGENIFDVYSGRDLTVTFYPGTAAPSVIYDVDLTPLSSNNEQIQAWCGDAKKWTEVFTPKDYDYLRLVAEGKIPYYVKGEQPNSGKWIDKAEYEATKKKTTAETDAKIQQAESQLMYNGGGAPVAPSVGEPVAGVGTPSAPVITPQPAAPVDTMVDNMYYNDADNMGNQNFDDDLPF